MAQQIVNIGTANNSGDGESLRSGGDKINDNFTELYSAYSSNVIVVNQVSDFGIIDSTKKYLINGFVDTGSTTINIPDGVKLNLVGLGYILSGLFSTENNYTMFQGNVAGVSDFSVSQLDLKVTGTSSKLFDIKGKTGFEVVRFNSVNFSDCTSIGVIDGFRQGEEFDTGRFGGTPQIEFKGTWLGGYIIDKSLTRFVNDSFTEALFKAGVGLVFNSRFKSDMNLDLGTNGSYLDFSASNFSMSNLLQLQNGIVTRDGSFSLGDTNIIPNITEKQNESLWKGNVGIPNTDKGGVMTVTTEVQTTISTIDEWVDLSGTFTLTKSQHTDNPTNGQLRNNTDNPVDYNLLSEFTIDGSANNVIEMRATVFRDNTSTFDPQDSFSRVIDNNVGGNDLAFFIMFDSFTLNPNDYVKYEVRNTTSTANLTALENQSKYKLQQRN
jgi:hypothetical protein